MTMKLCLTILFVGGASAFSPVIRAPAASVSVQQTAMFSSLGHDFFLKKKPATNDGVRSRTLDSLQKRDAVLDPDYTLTWSMALLGALIMWYTPASDGGPSLIGVTGGLFHMLFATLLWVQTRRVRCVFENDSFEFYNIKGPKLDLDNGAKLVQKPDNYVSGTINRWKYDTIINYGFFPSLDFPVICYFKETETPEEQWDKWFAAFDAYGGGQPHFFPGICNARQFKEQMELRGVARKPIPTLKK